MITRMDKEKQITMFSNDFDQAQAKFVVQFKGLNVEQMTDLRSRLRAEKAKLKVIRNTLSKKVLKQSDVLKESEDIVLKGPNAFVFAFGDASQTAKILREFAEEASFLVLKQGVLDKQVLSDKQVRQLASLPSLEELKAKLLSLFSTPARRCVSLMLEAPSSFVRVLNSRVNQEKSNPK